MATTAVLAGAATAAPSVSVLPVVGAEDDYATPLPEDATGWQKFIHNPVTKRVGKVLITLAIGAVVLIIINVALVPRSMKCVTPEDCRQIRRVNTILAGTKSLLNLIVGFALAVIVLHELGVNTNALIATAGVVGLVIGLAAQPVIKSFIAGLTFVTYDQFSLGDYVALDLDGAETVRGVVTEFTTQSITLQDFSGSRAFVPNSNVKVVINYSKNDQRAQVEVSFSYKGDVDVVLHEIQTLNTIMATAEPLKGKITRPPVLKGITKNDGTSYTVAVCAIAEPMSQAYVERYMRYQLLRLMQHMGIDASNTAYSEAASGIKPLPSALPPSSHELKPSPYFPETERGDISLMSKVSQGPAAAAGGNTAASHTHADYLRDNLGTDKFPDVGINKIHAFSV